MVSELGECIPCFPDNRGRFGATGSDLSNGMRTFVKAKKDFNIPCACASLGYVCIKSKPDKHTIYIQICKIHTHIYIHTYTQTFTNTYTHSQIHIHTYIHTYT